MLEYFDFPTFGTWFSDTFIKQTSVLIDLKYKLFVLPSMMNALSSERRLA